MRAQLRGRAPPLFLISIAIGLGSCGPAEPWTTLASPIDSGGGQLTFVATVRYVGIEGGFYQLVDDGRAHYDPTNLPPRFQREGLQTKVVVQLRPDMESFHGDGPIVTILRIRPATDH